MLGWRVLKMYCGTNITIGCKLVIPMKIFQASVGYLCGATRCSYPALWSYLFCYSKQVHAINFRNILSVSEYGEIQRVTLKCQLKERIVNEYLTTVQ